MFEVRETEEFSKWLAALRDVRAIARLAHGNPGDVEPVGSGVSELRINYGPGYRIYYVERGRRYVLLLIGGDKKTQKRDITRAKQLAQQYPE